MDWLLPMRVAGEGMFEVEPPTDGVGRYGGYLMAAAVRAAAATAEGMHLHALHASFLDRPDPGPISVAVECTRTARSSATRRVVVRPSAPAVVVTASFHAAATSDLAEPVEPARLVEQAEPAGATSVDAAPSSTELERLDQFTGTVSDVPLFDVRPIDADRWRAAPVYGLVHPYWARPAAPFGPGPAAAAAALALVSDYRVVGTATPAGEAPSGPVVTLDHSLWVHRPFPADEWLRYDAEPLVTAGGRALTRGTVRDTAGRLVASFVQEMLRLPAR